MPPRKRTSTRKTTRRTTKRKTCRTSKRRTNWNAQGWANVGNALAKGLDNYAANKRRMEAADEIRSSIWGGLKWLFGREKHFDTKEAMKVANDMKANLIKKGLDKSASIFTKIKEFKKTVEKLDFEERNGYSDLYEYHTLKVKEKYDKLYAKYKKVMAEL